MKENEIEFIGEIATQLTELYFDEDTFILIQCEDDVNELRFTEEAQDFYNERYDEIESLYVNLVKNK